MQREHAGRASWECQEELFRQEVENADDIRLSHRLMKKCMGDKKKFCNDVPAGQLSSFPGLALISRSSLGHKWMYAEVYVCRLEGDRLLKCCMMLLRLFSPQPPSDRCSFTYLDRWLADKRPTATQNGGEVCRG